MNNNIYKILIVFAITLGLNSCIEEYGEQKYYGEISLKIINPETIAIPISELTVSVKLYRAHTGKTTNLTLKVASISEDSIITTQNAEIEFGNYELRMANVIHENKPIYVAVEDSDNRAVNLDNSTLIPISKNILANEVTTFKISTVLFDPNKDKVEYDENTIGAFLELADSEIGTIQGEVKNVVINSTSGTVTSLTIKDKNNDELLVYGVFRISTEIYKEGQTLKVTGERDNYNGIDQMALATNKGHSIEIIGEITDDDFSIANFIALEDSVVGTVEGEIISENYNSSYGTVTSITIKDKNNDELLLYGVFKISSDRYELGKTVKATGLKVTYKETVQMSFDIDRGHSIEIINDNSTGGGDPTENTLLFTGSDFENWSDFLASLNTFGLNYTEQSATGGRNSSSSVHITGTTTANAYAFTVLAGNSSLPENYTKITMYIKGTASTKSLSLNLYYGESSTYAKANFGTINGSADVSITAITGNNDYSGSIDTNDQWVKVTIDLSDIDGFAFNTSSSDLNMFAVKVGKESDYDLYIDDITIE